MVQAMQSRSVPARELGPVVPVIVIDDAGRAVELARSLLAGGISCAEVTLRTPAALASIEAMADVPGFIVGAGTVRSSADVDDVVRAGGRFVVTPGVSTDVIERARYGGVTVVPGTSSATDLMTLLALGIHEVKLFPAAALGGPSTVSLLAAPFPEVGFMPSGGVTAQNARDYADLPSVFAVSGSWMSPRALIDEGRFDEITALSSQATELLDAR